VTVQLPRPEAAGAIVLVHGAWVGEWSWDPIVDDLQATGRRIYAVSLTGHGQRGHLSGPQVSLADHVHDVVRLVETHDLTEITLVGHSYGGRVISQASLELADRLAHLVYLDAHTPVLDDPGQTPARIAAAEANGGMLPFPAVYLPTVEMLGGEAGQAWFQARLEKHSFATFSAPWRCELPEHVSRTFVYASGDPDSRFAGYADVCKHDDRWQYHEIVGHHFLMMSHPDEVTRIIIDAASSVPTRAR